MAKTMNPASLRAGGKELRRVGEEIGRATDTLKNETTSKNSPWGGDDLGTLFGSLYTPLAEKAFEYYREAGAAVDELGEWLEKRASDHEKTEKQNESTINHAGGN